MWHHKLHRGGALGAKTLADVGSGASMGIAALSQDLTINGITVSPTFRYEAKNATTGLWTATVGEDLTGAGSGGTVGLDTPLLTDDEAVNGGGTRYWDSGSNALYAMGTKDFVIELVGKTPPNSSYMAATTSLGGSAPGWALGSSSAASERFVISLRNDTLTLVSAFSDNLPESTWYHAIVFFDRSGSAQWYVNGSASAAPTVVSSVSSAQNTNANNFLVGAYGTGSLPYGESFSYVAMWQRDAWLDTHLQASVAAERFARLNGTWSDALSKGPDQSLLRNSVATLEKQGKSGGQKLFTVGARWPRIEKRPDKYGRYATGYNSEGQHTNLFTYSEQFDNAAWTKTNTAITPNALVAPDGNTTVDAIVSTGATSTFHYVEDAVTTSAGATCCIGVFAKAGARSWILIFENNSGDGKYFNIADGFLGSDFATPGSSGMRYIGGGMYLCHVVVTVPTTVATVRIFAAENDGDFNFAGNGETSVYLWGAQITETAYPVSYIKTEGATVTRLADRCLYSGLTLPAKGSISCGVLHDGDIVSNAFLATLSDGGSADERVASFLSDASGTDSGRSFVRTGAVTQADVTGTTAVDERVWHEVRTPFDVNDVRVLIDGTSEGTPDTSASIPSTLDRIDLGSDQAGASQADSLVRLRLLSKATDKNVTDFGAIMAKSSAYISTPAAVAQSTSYANVGGTFTEVNSSDFTVSAAGVFTYTGTDTKRFACLASCSASVSTGTPLLTCVWEKNGTAVTSSETNHDVAGAGGEVFSLVGDIELANGDTLNIASKVDSGTPNLTVDTCSVVLFEVS